MRKIYFILSLIACILLSGCSNEKSSTNVDLREDFEFVEPSEKCENEIEAIYIKISPDEARQLMDNEENYIILDVRSLPEYKEGYIPGAIRISHDKINVEAESKLPDKNQLILVYCRSGNRSKEASEVLVSLGYTNVKDFGGIMDWPYEVIQDRDID